ncbi:MAG: transporter [Deltaproteobacteria bacterium]|jgi:predicted MFS family arabinose efflux permease|nr:transporter [Deltaproteobacteria bacterium]
MNLEQTVPDEIAFPEKDLAGRMVVLGFLAQNLAIGLTFGVYGAFVKPFADSFAITRGVAASGLAIITLVLGLASPWVGGLLHRRSIRDVMTAGAACMVLGFGLLVVAPTAWVVLLLCAVLGLGATLLGPLPAMALMTNWFDAGRGRAIGIVMIPFGVMLMPIVTTLMIEAVGWRLMFGSLALLLCALTPLLRLIRNGPRDHGAGSSADRPAVHGEADSNRAVQRRLLTDTHFWMIAVTSALILAAGTAIVTHLLAYATDLGIESTRASVLLAVSGGMGMLGSFLFGWLSDRVGGAAALAINAAAQAVFWLFLWYGGSFWFLLATSALIGTCGGGVVAPLSNLLSVAYGRQQFGQAFGLTGLIQLPFNFGAPLFMGLLFDATGSYRGAFLVHVLLFVVAAAAFAQFARTLSHPSVESLP